jgi:hypothetical protein
MASRSKPSCARRCRRGSRRALAPLLRSDFKHPPSLCELRRDKSDAVSHSDRCERPECLVRLQIDGGLGTQDGPAWVGHRRFPSSTGSSKKKRSILRPRVSLCRRPRIERWFHSLDVVSPAACGSWVFGHDPRRLSEFELVHRTNSSACADHSSTSAWLVSRRTPALLEAELGP